jgi:hypothetical protein
MYREVIATYNSRSYIEIYNLLLPNNQPSNDLPSLFNFTRRIHSLSDLKYEYHLLDYISNRKPLDKNKVLKNMYMMEYLKTCKDSIKYIYKYINAINISHDVSITFPNFNP